MRLTRSGGDHGDRGGRNSTRNGSTKVETRRSSPSSSSRAGLRDLIVKSNSRELRSLLDTVPEVYDSRNRRKSARLTPTKKVTLQSSQRTSTPISPDELRESAGKLSRAKMKAGSFPTSNDPIKKVGSTCNSLKLTNESKHGIVSNKRKVNTEELTSVNNSKKQKHVKKGSSMGESVQSISLLEVDELSDPSLYTAGRTVRSASGGHCEIDDAAQQETKDGPVYQSMEDLKHARCAVILEKQSTVGILDTTSRGEVDTDNPCIICKQRGIVKHCEGKGCKMSCHLSCIRRPTLTISPGIWMCCLCMKKKIKFGVRAVAKAVESVWDATEGKQNERLYFIKYKGFAHVHNQWMTESDMMNEGLEGLELLSRFKRRSHKEKMLRWKQEWTEPHRLLMKRVILPQKEADEFFSIDDDKISYCNNEWLVKWKHLGYEYATWELETEPFLCSSGAMLLIEDFEKRHAKSQKTCDSLQTSLALLDKRSPYQKLLRLPDVLPADLNTDDNLNSTNQLREFWHRSKNAILIDDQERVIKTILLLMSLLSCNSRPFLILSSLASLSFWEIKFNHLAPRINLVTYTGDKKIRKLIRELEFFGEEGSVSFQVLLSHPGAIIEDVASIDCIQWEGIIVDYCQKSKSLSYLEQLKTFPTDFRLLLLSNLPKGNCTELVNLLSFVDPDLKEGGSTVCPNNSIADFSILRERITSHIAYKRELDFSNYIEYWVPVPLSDVQTELYCCKLLSNSLALRRCLKVDQVGVLRELLISIRKLCDHPYLVDESLQQLLIKDHPPSDILEIGINACGKLLLLDKMLHEMHDRGLRTLIFFQSVSGSGRNPIGDILDDFLGQRFGPDTYERLERGLSVSKKYTAMNMFNDKSSGRFVFLIDSHACLRSIKLSGIDVIIIYDSDWNPLDDVRTLLKMNIESESEQIAVFRLYCCHTIEEKVLIHTKQDSTTDCSVQSISPSISNSLLSWGAALLFDRLDRMHQEGSTNAYSGNEKRFIEDTLLEFKTMLPMAGLVSTGKSNCIAKALLNGTTYSNSITLVGEKEGTLATDNLASFWTNLLDGRHPRWLYIPEPFQRSCRKTQNIKNAAKSAVKEHTRRKHSEVNAPARISDTSVTGKARGDSDGSDPVSHNDSIPSKSNHLSSETWKEDGPILRDVQRSLHLQLQPELLKLSEVLGLPDNVKRLTLEYLEYIMKHHRVSQDSRVILQAFNLALCWRASATLRYFVNHRQSLVLAAECLHYECDEELIISIYSKLRILKKILTSQNGTPSKETQSGAMTNEQLPLEENMIVLSEASGSGDRPPQSNHCLETDPACSARSGQASLVSMQKPAEYAEGVPVTEKTTSQDISIEIDLSNGSLNAEEASLVEAPIVTCSSCLSACTAAMPGQDLNIVDPLPDSRREQASLPAVEHFPLTGASEHPLPGQASYPAPEHVALTGASEHPLPEQTSFQAPEHVLLTGASEHPLPEQTSLPAPEHVTLTGAIEPPLPEKASVPAFEHVFLTGASEPPLPEQASLPACEHVLLTGGSEPPLPEQASVPALEHVLLTGAIEPPLPEQASLPAPEHVLLMGASESPLSDSLHTSVPLDSGFPGTTRLENRDVIGMPAVMPDILSEFFSLSQMIPSPLHTEPLRNELVKIKLGSELLQKRHDEKMQQLQNDCEAEIYEVHKKYEELIQLENSSYLQTKHILKEAHEKILLQQQLAEEFRLHIKHKGDFSAQQGTSQAQETLHAPHILQPRVSLRPFTVAQPAHASAPAVQAYGSTLLITSRSHGALSELTRQAPRPMPSSTVRLYGTTASQLPTHVSCAVRSDVRVPAPHLQRPRSQAHSSTGTTHLHCASNLQQGLHLSTGSTKGSSSSNTVPLAHSMSASNPVPTLCNTTHRLPSGSTGLNSSNDPSSIAISMALDKFITDSVGPGDCTGDTDPQTVAKSDGEAVVCIPDDD